MCAFEYAKPHLIPLLTRIWPLPDDLPTAAGMGNPIDHYPGDTPQNGFAFHREPPSVQRVLDTALAWAFHAAGNEKMAEWLADAEQRQKKRAK